MTQASVPTKAPGNEPDVGRVLATFRCWPGPVSWLVLIVMMVGAVVLNVSAVPDDPLWFRFFAAGMMLLLWGAFAFPGMLEKHRVCEHGLVLGYRRTGRSRYVVPWSSVDPGRIRTLTRAQLVSRHPAMPSSSPHYRIGTGPLAYRALAVNGLDSAQAGWLHIPGVLEPTDTVGRSRHRSTPYVWWLLGTPRPERLAQAIEEAMVADGFAAQGLAARAREQHLTLSWRPTQHPLPPRKPRAKALGVAGPRLP